MKHNHKFSCILIFTSNFPHQMSYLKKGSNFASKAKPPLFLRKPRSTKVKAGETIELKIKISATPDPTVKWLKDKTEIESNASITVVNESGQSILTIAQCKSSDSGVYTIIASNAAGEKDHSVTITVEGTNFSLLTYEE